VKTLEKPNKGHPMPATLSGFRPADFPLGSIESRAAARTLVEATRGKEASSSLMVREKVKDPLIWLQNHTQTKDPHWREACAKSPYRSFPEKPYFRPIIESYQREPVTFVAKSRDLMLSWLSVGYLTHACMITPGIEVLFQSQTEDKAAELVDYGKCLYDRSDAEIQKEYPLVAPTSEQSWLELEFANDSRIIGIPHGASKIRSYHPWALFIDEAAFVPDAGESYDEAISACQKIIVVSSANTGWFESVCVRAE
jgi:hypothetical protein